VINDPAVLGEAARFVRIIIRRPHAYEFRARYAGVPIPGVAILDDGGTLKGSAALTSAEELSKLLREIRR